MSILEATWPARRPVEAVIEDARERQRRRRRLFVLAIVIAVAASGIGYGVTQPTSPSATPAASALSDPCGLLPVNLVEQVLGVNVTVTSQTTDVHNHVFSRCSWIGPSSRGQHPAFLGVGIVRESERTFVQTAAVANGEVAARGVGAVAFAPPDWPGGTIRVWRNGDAITMHGSRPSPTHRPKIIPVAQEVVPLLVMKRLAADAATHLQRR
jgi:hypothetical protein